MDGRDIALLGDLLGADADEDDVEVQELYLMGAPATARFGPRGSISARKRKAVATVRRAVQSPIPGQPAPGPRYIPLGFDAVQFVNAGATSLTTTARTQKPFKGVRLVIVVNRTGATGLVTITQFNAGVQPQQVNIAGLPAEAFAPNAFQVDLALDPVEPGVDFTIQYTVSAAPGVGETIDIGTCILGLAIA